MRPQPYAQAREGDDGLARREIRQRVRHHFGQREHQSDAARKVRIRVVADGAEGRAVELSRMVGEREWRERVAY